ncbi:Myosin-IIIb [Stylophora pistillata]|uniref:Myosin-IIIb n=1 Tax=Stylophora pistillata TaxID=50429 RepID=A0A2B4RUT4_STYPI|nr:Myosin-IIIb [Stylophora pistillata]
MAGRKKDGIDDLATLSELNEEIIIRELQARYNQDVIYTYVGDILIALNPFKPLEIYHKSTAETYKMAQKSAQPPHIFAIANSAYQAILGVGGASPTGQCCVISGESGAGKTESAKLLISHLVELSRGTSQLEQQILQVNPLLEAFGNAQTLMNDNSSRFGKYIQLKFQQGMVIGAKISEYLLEKSRVVRQSRGEENFHIFYYLFAGLSADEHCKYGLTRPDKYRYLCDGTASLKKVTKNKMMFNELLNAMDMVGFLDEEQEDMFTVLGGVLNMGNIAFEMDENEGAIVKDAHGPLRTAAKLLGVDTEKLSEVLTSTSTTTRGSVIKRRLKDHQAMDVRDATSKAMYGRLFGWIVNKVNQLLAPPMKSRGEDVTEIGILDIFGFEHFEKNSFEQACINLANEQLQFFFNQHIFLWEQEEYKKEGIDWTSVTFADNKPVLDLFLNRPIGVLALLDEESHFPQSTDQSFVEKLRQNCGKSSVFIKSRQSNTNLFGICHYAGKVEYDATGFLEKNRDTLPPGVVDMLRRSDNSLIATIFSGTITRTGTLALQGRVSKGNVVRRTKRLSKARQGMPATKKPTVGAQFKISDSFDLKYVREQLAYTGVLETTRIRREGFALRISFADFIDRRTKVFLKYWHAEKLAEQLQKAQEAVITIQKEILRKKTLNYIGLHFPSPPPEEDEDYFPPPPPEALGLSPRKSHGSLDEIEIEDEFLTDDMEDEEDVFIGQPHPIKSAFGSVANKEAAVQWFQETQVPKGVVQDESGGFSKWFHGIISRRESERLLSNKPVGCFLIRVSESRFGYTLSYRAQGRCKHYMIDQTRSGKFLIVGMRRVYKSLKEMVSVHKKEPINPEGDVLIEPCGQESQEEVDYVELIQVLEDKRYVALRDVERNNNNDDDDDVPPPLPPKSPKSPKPKEETLPPPIPARNYQSATFASVTLAEQLFVNLQSGNKIPLMMTWDRILSDTKYEAHLVRLTMGNLLPV